MGLTFTQEEIDLLLEDGACCYCCHSPFKECDTVIPGIGVVIGETDVEKHNGLYWHAGCIADYYKEKARKEYRESILTLFTPPQWG